VAGVPLRRQRPRRGRLRLPDHRRQRLPDRHLLLLPQLPLPAGRRRVRGARPHVHPLRRPAPDLLGHRVRVLQLAERFFPSTGTVLPATVLVGKDLRARSPRKRGWARSSAPLSIENYLIFYEYHRGRVFSVTILV